MELKESGEGENLGIVPDKTQGVPEDEKGLMEIEGKRKERNRWVERKRESPGRQQA